MNKIGLIKFGLTSHQTGTMRFWGIICCNSMITVRRPFQHLITRKCLNLFLVIYTFYFLQFLNFLKIQDFKEKLFYVVSQDKHLRNMHKKYGISKKKKEYLTYKYQQLFIEFLRAFRLYICKLILYLYMFPTRIKTKKQKKSLIIKQKNVREKIQQKRVVRKCNQAKEKV